MAKNKNKGFTLPEVLIAISILVIISTVAVVSFRSFDKRNNLRGVRDEILTALQDMENDGQNGRLVYMCLNADGSIDTAGVNRGICKDNNECSTLGCGLSYPPGGYGIYFDGLNKQYKLFADIFTDGVSGVKGFDSNEVLLDGVKNLPSGIEYGYTASYIDIFNASNNINSFPIQFIFGKDSIGVLDGVGYNENLNIKIQIIPIRNADFTTVNILVNKLSGLIYSDYDRQDPT